MSDTPTRAPAATSSAPSATKEGDPVSESLASSPTVPPEQRGRASPTAALADIRSDRDALLQSDAIDKASALRMLQQHHALEELLLRATHEKEVQRMAHETAIVREKQRSTAALANVAADIAQLHQRHTKLEEVVQHLTASHQRRK